MFRFLYYFFTRLSFVAPNVKLGKNVKIGKFCNIYGPDTHIMENVKIGAYVEIQDNVLIGSNCKISSHSFLCSNLFIGSETFLGHSVVTTNDLKPTACNKDGTLKTTKDWESKYTFIGCNVSIGSNCTLLPVRISQGSMIGAGSIVVKDVPPFELWLGCPAKQHKCLSNDES